MAEARPTCFWLPSGRVAAKPWITMLPLPKPTYDLSEVHWSVIHKILANSKGKMMFVSGETTEPSTDTIAVIEQIVQDQVKEVLRRGTEIANRSSQRAISIDTLLYVIRDNKAKCDRVRNFLSWKDVRKNVKESNDDSKADEVPLDDPAGATNPQDMAARGMNKHKKAKIKLPWDVHTMFAHSIPERDVPDDDAPGADDPDSDTEMNTATLARLRNADERTRNMTKEEYVHWSECRQASFTFRKGKRFREWAGIGAITDSKPSDDVIDVLGFLTYEIVEWLTETALKIKAHEEASAKMMPGGTKGDGAGSKRKAEDGDGDEEGEKKGMSLFRAPQMEVSPILPRHIQEAFRLSQRPTMKELRFAGVRKDPNYRRPLQLI